MALEEVASISFDFKDETGGGTIQILNHEQYSYIRDKMANPSFSFSDLSSMIKMAKETFRLDMSGLDVVDKIHMEQMIEKIILEKGGVSVP